MNNGNGVIMLIIAILIIAVGAFFIFGQKDSEPKAGEGRVYFSITDAAADMNAVSEVNLKIDGVEVYSEAEGWTRLSTENDSFALLELRDSGTLKLAAKGNLKADTYSRVRVRLDSATVEETGGETKTAAMTSGEFVFDSTVEVNEQADTHVTFDVLADKSLHTSTDGSYVFAPVVSVESKSDATVSVDADSNVSVAGGTVQASGIFGSDIDGSVRANFELPANAAIDVGLFGNVQTDTEAKSDTNVNGSGSVNVGGSGDLDATLESTTDINATI